MIMEMNFDLFDDLHTMNCDKFRKLDNSSLHYLILKHFDVTAIYATKQYNMVNKIIVHLLSRIQRSNKWLKICRSMNILKG